VQDFSALQRKSKFFGRLLANIRAGGFNEPTPIQMQAIPLLLKRREVLAVAPTGVLCRGSPHFILLVVFLG
jgi:ATP-dependent RNA helicase DDX52/ROK1